MLFTSFYSTITPTCCWSVRPAAAQLRAALEASKACEGRAGLHHDYGTLVVHLAARFDETHAAAAVGKAATAARSLLKYLKPLGCFDVSKSCCQIRPCRCNIAKS